MLEVWDGEAMPRTQEPLFLVAETELPSPLPALLPKEEGFAKGKSGVDQSGLNKTVLQSSSYRASHAFTHSLLLAKTKASGAGSKV